MTNLEILKVIEESFDKHIKAQDWQGRTANIIGKEKFLTSVAKKILLKEIDNHMEDMAKKMEFKEIKHISDDEISGWFAVPKVGGWKGSLKSKI